MKLSMVRPEHVELIDMERFRQDQKWGDQSGNDPAVWATVLSEECGEAAQAALHVQFHHGFADGEAAIDHLRTELVQVAAVAVAWLEAIDRRLLAPADPDQRERP